MFGVRIHHPVYPVNLDLNLYVIPILVFVQGHFEMSYHELAVFSKHLLT